MSNCLIVDDDMIFVAMLEQTLKNRGLENVYTASDGADAIKFLETHHSDIHALTLDLNMPNMDGIRFLTMASKMGFTGEIFLASSEHKTVLKSAMQLARMLHLSCKNIFPKPVNFDELADCVLNADKSKSRPINNQIDQGEIEIALSSLQIEAYYQPRVDLKTCRINGAEMLARFSDSRGNFLNTQEVIKHAENTDRIGDLTWEMLENLVKCVQIFQSRNLPVPVLSVNINGQMMASSEFSVELVKFFKNSRVDPRNIILEITETGLPPDPAASLEALARIRMNGFGIAIDDFGTGYSNVENLKNFPFTELKIDKSFVSNVQNDAFSRECIVTSIRLAREQDLRIIAEGIETENQLRFIRSQDIDEVQGYLFSRPLPLRDFVELFSAGRPLMRFADENQTVGSGIG